MYPLGLVPKAQLREHWINYDFSSPEGNSINDGIGLDCRSMIYQSIDYA